MPQWSQSQPPVESSLDKKQAFIGQGTNSQNDQASPKRQSESNNKPHTGESNSEQAAIEEDDDNPMKDMFEDDVQKSDDSQTKQIKDEMRNVIENQQAEAEDASFPEPEESNFLTQIADRRASA